MNPAESRVTNDEAFRPRCCSYDDDDDELLWLADDLSDRLMTDNVYWPTYYTLEPGKGGFI